MPENDLFGSANRSVLSTQHADRIRDLWQAWQRERAPHDRLYFEFHETVIKADAELADVSLYQMLGALLPSQDAP